MQVNKRATRASNSHSRGTMDIDTSDDLETSRTVINPLHSKQPSSAYLESQKRALSASTLSSRDRNPVNSHVRPGIRTIASAVILFGGGLILLILGAIVFAGTKSTADAVTKEQGQDLLIIGAVSKY